MYKNESRSKCKCWTPLNDHPLMLMGSSARMVVVDRGQRQENGLVVHPVVGIDVWSSLEMEFHRS